MDSDQLPVLVTMTEIAALARVQRPVVSTWRRRYPGFPAPVAGPARSPRFDGRAVVRWLSETGLGNAEPEQMRAETVLHALVTQADRFGPRRLVEVVSGLLCLRLFAQAPLIPPPIADDEQAWAKLLARAARLDSEDEFLLRELRADDASALPLVRLTEELVEAAYSPAGAHEWLLGARARLGLTELLGTDTLAPQAVELLVQLADPQARRGQESVVAADPHARSGDLLAAVLRTVHDASQVTVLGAEPQEWLARLTRRRLLLAGVDEVGLDVCVGLDLEERLADPDLVITQLPYQAGESRSPLTALAQVEQVADLLRPGRTGIVLGPADALVDALDGRTATALRAELLRSGVVEAVLALPGGAIPHLPGHRTAVWVLTRDPIASARGYVLFADLASQPLTDQVCARAAEDVVLWRAEGRRPDGHDPRYGRIVSVADLVARPGAALTPPGPPASQVLARSVSERPALIAEAEGLLERSAERAREHADRQGPLRGFVVRRNGARSTLTTVGALTAAGRVRKVKGHRIDPADLSPEGHHRVLGPDELSGSTGAPPRRIDRAVLATGYEQVPLTEPGDVVYTTVPLLRVLVDHEGFSVVAFPARALRVNPDAARPLTPRVLAALITAARDTARSPGAVRASRRIEDYAVPDLDGADVARLDALLADIELRRALLRAQDDALREIADLTIAGFADGTLAIDRP